MAGGTGALFGGAITLATGVCGLAISTTLEREFRNRRFARGGGTGAACTGVAGTSAANNIDASCSCNRSDSRRSRSDEDWVTTGVCEAFGATGAAGLLSVAARLT